MTTSRSLAAYPFILLTISALLLIMGSFGCITAPAATKNHTYLSELSAYSINATLLRAGEYLLNNQRPDGSILYLLNPKNGSAQSGDNMIRQFMTSSALYEMYRYTGDERYLQAYESHVNHLLALYYVEEDGFGHIVYRNESRLGSSAVALSSIRHLRGLQHERERLTEYLLMMHNESSGRFATFYRPWDIYKNQRFYSGEGMLALLHEYELSKDPVLLESTLQSFDFYRHFFVGPEKRPAFVPWHTQAYYKLYRITGDETFVKAIFGMNDWLIASLLELDCSNPRDQGRFYNERIPAYGVPHTSSTAVYLEGLSYAYELAIEQQDEVRARHYRQALVLGARNLLEMQFSAEEVEKRGLSQLSIGGIRTTLENEKIRIDNNQHTIMALLRVLAVLSEDDIRLFVETHPEYECP